MLFGIRVEEGEHGAHGDHVKATRHFGKQQVGWDFDVECEGVEKYEEKDDHGYDQVEVLERVLELSSLGSVTLFCKSAKLDQESCYNYYDSRGQSWQENPEKKKKNISKMDLALWCYRGALKMSFFVENFYYYVARAVKNTDFKIATVRLSPELRAIWSIMASSNCEKFKPIRINRAHSKHQL